MEDSRRSDFGARVGAGLMLAALGAMPWARIMRS